MVFIYESFRFIIQITMPKTKRITNYCNYATRNCDAGERFATAKSTVSNRRDTIWDFYVGERVATPVFTTRCISINSPLNGRKVISWILLRENMMKI